MPEINSSPELSVHMPAPDLLVAKLSGNWRTQLALPGLEPLRKQLGEGTKVKALEFDSTSLAGWNSRFVAFVSRCNELCAERHIDMRTDGLPEGVSALLRLANSVPESKETRRHEPPSGVLGQVGELAIRSSAEVSSILAFLGDSVIASFRLFRGRAQFRWSDMFLVMEECGPQALGIVALINFLVGLILAFVGATALARFGASIYVADMVAIGAVREMGCIMTGIILSGRTGAAFAAQLGTMKVNEEITALQTFGISPIEFLVLPRILAMVLMMPLLCVFADLINIAGGFFVSITMLDVTAVEYLNRTKEAIVLKSFLLGIGKGSFFGFLVAVTGCLRGMQCGNNAAAVGEATTRSVVAGITSIIASDGVFAVICRALDI